MKNGIGSVTERQADTDQRNDPSSDSSTVLTQEAAAKNISVHRPTQEAEVPRPNPSSEATSSVWAGVTHLFRFSPTMVSERGMSPANQYSWDVDRQ